MSTRRLIDGENDPKMNTNDGAPVQPAIAKGKPNPTPGGRREMKHLEELKRRKKRKSEKPSWYPSRLLYRAKWKTKRPDGKGPVET